jgi:type II secretion system protein G
MKLALKPKHAFTLLELLVVVAIIGILTSIAVPNFNEATVRTRIAKTKADLERLSHALECYRLDTNGVPVTLGPFAPSFLRRLAPLTTPVAYLTHIPTDPFQPLQDPWWEGFITQESERSEWNLFYIYNRSDAENGGSAGGSKETGHFAWSLTGSGPDRIIKYPYYFYPQGFVRPERYVYDASNGLLSQGDFFERSTQAKP